MNEIEKLYKNAGVEKSELHGFHCHRSCDICENEHKCKICKYSELIYSYPSFTTEKQLELIKFCLDKYEVIGKTPDVDRCILYITSDAEDRAFVVTDYISCETWEESIAGLINRFWQDLTEEEKQQIKEILE